MRPFHIVGLAFAALLALAGGCAQPGRVEIAALDYRAIDPPGPDAARVDLNEAYWWTDEDGRLWIALRTTISPLFGLAGTTTLQYSFTFDRLPAGKSRNYDVLPRDFRAVARLGPSESRFTASLGIAAVYRERGDRLRGSFRLHVRRHARLLLGGWSQPTSYLMTGSFTALNDATRGRAIAAETETNGWEREPLFVPTTPTETPPVAPGADREGEAPAEPGGVKT